jgi:uncharacterized membrane protein
MNSPLPSRDQLLVHFYRAVVGHMDVWRQRMDATTNWAVATSAGMMTFTFTTPVAPHFIMLMALAFDAMFLVMESRRYQIFDLWRRRFRSLNHYLVAPVLAEEGPPPDELRRQYSAVAADLGRTVPHLPLMDAVGYRIRRNYGYLFTLGILAWLLKLEVHPSSSESIEEFVRRAAVGFVPRPIMLALVGVFVVIATGLAVRAPSEGMLGWAEVPSPLDRWMQGTRKRRAVRRRHASMTRKRKPKESDGNVADP